MKESRPPPRDGKLLMHYLLDLSTGRNIFQYTLWKKLLFQNIFINVRTYVFIKYSTHTLVEYLNISLLFFFIFGCL